MSMSSVDYTGSPFVGLIQVLDARSRQMSPSVDIYILVNTPSSMQETRYYGVTAFNGMNRVRHAPFQNGSNFVYADFWLKK